MNGARCLKYPIYSALLILAGCGTGSRADATNAAAPMPTAQTPTAQTPTARPTPRATTASKPVDVTAAGFPFKTGYYVTEGTCNKNNFNIVEFTRKYRHEYEADQNQDFTKILKLSDGRYRITQHISADEMVDASTEIVTFTQTGPTSFQTDEKVQDYDAKGRWVLKGIGKTYLWCPTSSLGVSND